jgi:hypothetical protein
VIAAINNDTFWLREEEGEEDHEYFNGLVTAISNIAAPKAIPTIRNEPGSGWMLG